MNLRTIYRTWEEAVREIVTQLLAYEQKVTTDLSDHVSDTAAAHAASAIANTPAGTIAATTVQAALNELDSEKALLAGSASQAFSAGVLTVATAAGSTIAIETAIAPTPLNSWVNSGGSLTAAGYWKDAYGMVHVKAHIKDGTIGSPAFQLAAGYRPAESHYFTTSSNSLFGVVLVEPSGDVTPLVGSNISFAFGDITFRKA